MKKILEHQVSFPVNAESDSFTAALATALVIVQGYTKETPYWCVPNRRYCIHCSSCGDNMLERHQTSIYHCLLTASTLAFGFDDPWDDSVEPHTLPGFSYLRFDGTSSQEEVFCIMKNSLDNGLPTLLRLENEMDSRSRL